jgi:hypothetical protein
MATEPLYKLPSTSYQSNIDLHLIYQHRRHNARYEVDTAPLQKSKESENKMEAPRSFEAAGTSRATKQHHFLYLQLNYSNARMSVVLDEVCMYLNIGLLKMIVWVLTTCHTQYTWDRSIRIFLLNRTTLQVFVTYLTGVLYVHPLWF